MVKNLKMQAMIRIMIGAILLLSAIWGYFPIPNHMNEYTFLSNTIEGFVLLYSGIVLITKHKHIPPVVDLCLVILAFIMLGICVTNYQMFGFGGAYLFLHLINPIMLFMLWTFVTEKGKIKDPKHILSVLILPAMYMIFLFGYGLFTNDYIYSIFDINELGLLNVIMVVLFVGVFFLGIAYILYLMDKKTQDEVHQRL